MTACKVRDGQTDDAVTAGTCSNTLSTMRPSERAAVSGRVRRQAATAASGDAIQPPIRQHAGCRKEGSNHAEVYSKCSTALNAAWLHCLQAAAAKPPLQRLRDDLLSAAQLAAATRRPVAEQGLEGVLRTELHVAAMLAEMEVRAPVVAFLHITWPNRHNFSNKYSCTGFLSHHLTSTHVVPI